MSDDHDPGRERAVLRRHAADATLMAGGATAILLQLADPRVAAGVARHSRFRDRPLDRLVGTHAYLTALVFGDEQDIRHVSRIVDARHARVRGDGEHPHRPAYDARDADAQRWVAATLLAVALDLEERLNGARLDTATADALVRGYAPIAARLQGAPAGWPATRAEFEAWWADRLESLQVGDDARSVARDLLAGTGLPPVLVPLMVPVRLVTAGLLPPALRAAYGINWTPRVERAADGWLTAIAVLRRIVPPEVRAIPTRTSLRRLRRRSRYAEGDLRGRG
ncbi:oxygenase MpaB family protein [Agromyces sp. M3QZ16-3]|uniref:oxygenase MpaB family protein n=1 Tax=Agromyces sp. M3QZ16-3 TaxID=3447585 RepID=UPI003F691FD0